MTKTYFFKDLFEATIKNPIVKIDPIVKELNPDTMTICVSVELKTPQMNYGITLENVKVHNLNYDATTLQIRVMTKLSEYELKLK